MKIISYICNMYEGFVYKWTNIKNGMMYIGSHKGLTTDDYIGSGVYFKRAYEKNPNHFTREILYIGNDYRKYEDDYLKLNDCSNNSLFYNLKNDAIGGWSIVQNEETYKKRGKSISISKKGIPPLTAFRDKTGDKNPMYNKSHSDKTRKIMSEMAKKRDFSFHHKKIIILPDNIIFNSLNECAEYFNTTHCNISNRIKRGGIPKRGIFKNKLIKFYKSCE